MAKKKITLEVEMLELMANEVSSSTCADIARLILSDLKNENAPKASEAAKIAYKAYQDGIKKQLEKRTPAKKKNIPSWTEFKAYAELKSDNINEVLLRRKYESWIEAGWRCGKKLRPIKVWKTTLLNTLKYLENEKTSRKQAAKYSARDEADEVKTLFS